MSQPPDPPQKVLTLAEAQALLPKVIAFLKQLQGIQHSVVETTQQLHAMTGKLSQGNGYPIRSIQERIQELTKHQLQLIDAFQSALDQCEALGCIIKDLQVGLVDFYALRNEELIFLCWKSGEERIGFWHAIEGGGYASRQPL